MPTYTQSPYAFVPLADKVVFPDWAEQVSHDVPFSDGLDGRLDITVTALSPIFIRDGKDEDRNNPQDRSTDFFSTADGTYCIPGTSLKGMLRNVLEIASFAKMRQVTDRRYGIRDLQLPKYTKEFTDDNLNSKVRAGLLDISSPDWKIYPCEYALWSREELDPTFGNRKMSAAEKYQEWDRKHHTLKKSASIHKTGKTDAKGKSIIPHNHADFKAKGENLKQGVLVFTGQPQEYKPDKKQQKHHEFFFYDLQTTDYIAVDPPETITLDEYGHEIRRNQQDFIFVHCEQSSAGDFDKWVKESYMVRLRQNFFHGCIPVFYLENSDGSLRGFGLAQLFRLTGKISVGQALRNVSPDHFPRTEEEFRPDLADLIFGYVNGRRDALRGRVHISPCLAQGTPQPLPLVKLILGEPRPSFYPAYLKQPEHLKNKDEYNTFLDDKAELRGWKRYPVLNKGWEKAGEVRKKADDKQQANDKIWTQFRPLPAETVFKGTVRYHNLRPVELGALIWAIQLRNSDYYCHALGMAKPYGYGKVRISIEGLGADEMKSYRQAFTEYIQQQLNVEKFEQLPQIKALLNMTAYDNQEVKDWDFSYFPKPKDYAAVKGNKKDKANPVPAQYLADFPEPKRLQKAPAKANVASTAAKPELKLTPEQQDFYGKVTKNKMKGNDFFKKLSTLPPFPKSVMDEMTEKIPPRDRQQRDIVQKCTAK